MKMLAAGDTKTLEIIPTGMNAPKKAAETGHVAICADADAERGDESFGGSKGEISMLRKSEKTRIPASAPYESMNATERMSSGKKITCTRKAHESISRVSVFLQKNIFETSEISEQRRARKSEGESPVNQTKNNIPESSKK